MFAVHVLTSKGSIISNSLGSKPNSARYISHLWSSGFIALGKGLDTIIFLEVSIPGSHPLGCIFLVLRTFPKSL